MNKDQLIKFYSDRRAVHAARAEDESLKPSERNRSKYKAIKYKEEMFRWMFMTPADFTELENTYV